LSLVPMLNAGIGINFGLPVGIIAGLIGLCVAINFRITHLAGFLTALVCSVPICVIFGMLYARLLKRVAGKEEIAATFVGFSLVSASDVFWATAPFDNPAMLWPIGGPGMRPLIGLKDYFEKVLNASWAFSVVGITVPVGLLLCFGLLCGGLHLFFKTKTGKAILAVGENETFARLAGIDVQKVRTAAVVLSTLIGAWGIAVYAQSYGFVELYDAPLMMAFPAASAILIGGAIGRRATICHVILGTYLLQTTYILSAPIANAILIPEVAEILRMMITNLVILYAMLHRGGAPSS
jgi:simple sugar transport system permease protein